MTQLSRRCFLQSSSSAAGSPCCSAARRRRAGVLGANDRVRVAIAGGTAAARAIQGFLDQEECRDRLCGRSRPGRAREAAERD